MTPENKMMGAIITEVVHPLWSLGARRAEVKVSPADNLAWVAMMARRWQEVLATTVRHACRDPDALAYMGYVMAGAADDTLEQQDALAFKIFDFTVHLVQERGMDLCREHWKPPWSLGILLPCDVVGDADDVGNAIALKLREWQAAVSAEFLATKSLPWARLVRELTFLKWPAVRVPYMLLERSGVIDADLDHWLNSMFCRKGDSRFAENLFRDIRHTATKFSTNGMTGRSNLHARLASAKTLTQQTHVRVTEEDMATEVPPAERQVQPQSIGLRSRCRLKLPVTGLRSLRLASGLVVTVVSDVNRTRPATL